jgi:hypothetical protein
MNDDILCNRSIIGLANVTLKTHSMSHRATSGTPFTIVELQNSLNLLFAYSPHLGRAEHSQDGAGRGDGKRLMNNIGGSGNGNGAKNPRPEEH